MKRIGNILTGCFEHGYSVEELKTTVIDTLSPFFSNAYALKQYWTDAELLSAFEYIIRYQCDEIFSSKIIELIKFYQAVYVQYPNEMLDIVTHSVCNLLQKENIMWHKRNNEISFESDELDEIVVKAMAQIGSVLEIGVKPILMELWAYVKLISNGRVDYKKIQELRFGTIIQNLLNAHYFEDILQTKPQMLKLSDWRNIAYHHSYRVLQSQEFLCTYGKDNSVVFNVDELKSYTYQIIRAANILSIARMFFIFDHLEAIKGYCTEHGNDYSTAYISKSLQKNSIAVSFLSQGYKLLSIHEDDEFCVADIQDLTDTSSMSKTEKMKRWIHVSQYQMIIWKLTQKEKITINYFSPELINEFSCGINGDICRKVFEGTKNPSDIAAQMEIDIKI